MSYITREDGEHFVIPSYRDVITSKQKSFIKKEILLLSQSYGEYITLQKKNDNQYEVAFSPDTGYLLGESLWHYFKRPLDMIYCEAIPNTTEAILVIVKNGSVYLDGSFPLDSIPEELVVFLTQQNNFEICIYGDVPISQTPEIGKFSFEAAAVKSFTILDKPVFSTLPLLKIYQLQLVDQVLKAHGIGVFPTKQVVLVALVVGIGWLVYSYMTTEKVEKQVVVQVSPYQEYFNILMSPAPDVELKTVLETVNSLFNLPQWTPSDFKYAKGSITAKMKSQNGKIEDLMQWAKANDVTVNFNREGLSISKNITVTKRPAPKQIYNLTEVLGVLIDRIHEVYPENSVVPEEIKPLGAFKSVNLSINIEGASPMSLFMIVDQLKGLPLVTKAFEMGYLNNSVKASIKLQVVGS